MDFRPRAQLASLLIAASMVLGGCASEEPFARLSGVITHEELREISGLTASRVHEGVLWVHNDGGHTPDVYAISNRGRLLAKLHLQGVANTDWEDIASFEQNGTHYLLIADTGDNGGLRKTLQLHAVAEPDVLDDASVEPAWTITFRWPDGPRDVEAVAVDASTEQILLISKRRRPPELFALPLPSTSPAGVQTAKKLGLLAGVPTPDAQQTQRQPQQARLIGQVTAADIAPDASTLAVLTYQDLLLYPRKPDETWAQAVAKQPSIEPLPLVPQPEALGFSALGTGLFVTGEFSPAPLYWLRPQQLRGE